MEPKFYPWWHKNYEDLVQIFKHYSPSVLFAVPVFLFLKTSKNKWQEPAVRARSGVLKIRKNVTNKQTDKQTDRETNYRGPSNQCTDGAMGGAVQLSLPILSNFYLI